MSLIGRTIDRIAHRWRRPAAIELLRAGDRPRSVLVICHGNVCRSPYAAAVLRRRLDERGVAIPVDSAGFFSPQRRPPADALAAASARGIDLSAHRSQMVSRDQIEKADLLVAMSADQLEALQPRARAVLLGDFDPEAIPGREIADPFGSRRSVFDECYTRIDRCVEELVAALLGPLAKP